jgi:hypothetical protein
MKNLFCTWVIGVILIAAQSAAAAQPAALEKETSQKQKVKIVVVEKKEARGSSPSQKPRFPNRERKP